jgi:hypothetical protein
MVPEKEGTEKEKTRHTIKKGKGKKENNRQKEPSTDVLLGAFRPCTPMCLP